jgi:4'-phosphopantetheinyl transferase
MPLLDLNEPAEGLWAGLWAIREKEAWFMDNRTWSAREQAELQQIKVPGRRLEWLAARHLLFMMAEELGCLGGLVKDEFGKPFLPACPEWYISLSHTRGYCRVAMSRKPCGTDIQQFSEKIARIAPRFIHPEEQPKSTAEDLSLYLHIVWSAKEAMYKAYGKKSLDFIRHIRVNPLTMEGSSGLCYGSVQKEEYFARYQLMYSLGPGYVMVDAIEVGSEGEL